MITNFKIFEIHSELDPYGEEIWEQPECDDDEHDWRNEIHSIVDPQTMELVMMRVKKCKKCGKIVKKYLKNES